MNSQFPCTSGFFSVHGLFMRCIIFFSPFFFWVVDELTYVFPINGIYRGSNESTGRLGGEYFVWWTFIVKIKRFKNWCKFAVQYLHKFQHFTWSCIKVERYREVFEIERSRKKIVVSRWRKFRLCKWCGDRDSNSF